MAGALFIVSSLIPRKGDYVVNGTRFGDPAYRDVRGVPFVFLKRSLADGECDIRDVQLKLCNPKVGNEPYQIIISNELADIAVWIFMSTLLIVPAWRISTQKYDRVSGS